MTTQLRRFVALLALVVMTSACSGGSPTSPTPTQPGPPVQTVLKVAAEYTGEPVAGASVWSENPKQFGTTNAQGEVIFPNAPVEGTRIQIEHSGFTSPSIHKVNAQHIYGLLPNRGDVPEEFVVDFIFGGSTQTGSAKKPRNNALDIVLDDDHFRTSTVVGSFQRVCQKIEAVGYACRVHQSIDAIQGLGSTTRGTLVIFRYGGAEGDTTLQWTGGGTDHTYTMRGDTSGMGSESANLTKLITPLGLKHHSWPNGGASTRQIAADFSAWEKRAIAIYKPRTEPTCYSDKVQLPVAGVFGDTCSYQTPFVK